MARMTELSRTKYLKLLWDVDVSLEYLISVSSFSRLQVEAGPLGDGNAPSTCIILEEKTQQWSTCQTKIGLTCNTFTSYNNTVFSNLSILYLQTTSNDRSFFFFFFFHPTLTLFGVTITTHHDNVASAASLTLMEAGLCSLSPLYLTSCSPILDLLPEMPSSTISNTSIKQSWKTEQETQTQHIEKEHTYIRDSLHIIFYCLTTTTYLFIEHVRMLGEPYAEALEGSDDHGV